MRLKPDKRKAAILTAAVKLSEKKGYLNVTRDDIAKAAGVSTGLVNRYYMSMPNLRDNVMREAIRLEIIPIVAQGIASGCPIAVEAPGTLRLKAAMFIAG